MPGDYSTWRKPRRSGHTGGNCVEIGFGGSARAVRDTKQAAGSNQPVLEFGSASFAAFLDRVKSGELG